MQQEAFSRGVIRPQTCVFDSIGQYHHVPLLVYPAAMKDIAIRGQAELARGSEAQQSRGDAAAYPKCSPVTPFGSAGGWTGTELGTIPSPVPEIQQGRCSSIPSTDWGRRTGAIHMIGGACGAMNLDAGGGVKIPVGWRLHLRRG
jgi:hypothetical protein